jgi:hypothetical protein
MADRSRAQPRRLATTRLPGYAAQAGPDTDRWRVAGVEGSDRTDAGSLPQLELNWRRNADEVERLFPALTSVHDPLDRLRLMAGPAGFSIRFARVRSSPTGFGPRAP